MVKKRFIIIMLFFMIIFGSSYGEEILQELNLQGKSERSLLGGIDYILNDKSPYDLIFYFKLYNREVSDNKYFFGRNKETVLKMFDFEYLHTHYSQEYIQLKNGEKFLYGKITALPSYIGMLKLELYFIDKNNVEKKKVFYKEMDIENEAVYSILRKINMDRTEGGSPAIPYVEEIGIITEEKKIHKKLNYYYRKLGNISDDEVELHAYLLRFFEKEIPKEFFELRKKYLDEMMED